MKQTLLVTLILFFSGSAFSQKMYCDGWEEGYTSGKTASGEFVGIIPICPFARLDADTYEVGFQLGYEEATGVVNSVIMAPSEAENNFCGGWGNGFTNTMRKHGQRNYVMTNCPSPMISEDNYESGYIKGLTAANKQLELENDEIVGYDPDGKFCDGWEKGFKVGLQLWAEKHNAMTPLRILPICPIPDLNQDNYTSGFELGKNKALADMGD